MQGFLEIVYWLVALEFLGLAFWPLGRRLFRDFEDRGWLFAKVLGILLPAYLLWVCNCLHILRFTRWNALLCAVLPCIIIYAGWIFFPQFKRKEGQESGNGVFQNPASGEDAPRNQAIQGLASQPSQKPGRPAGHPANSLPEKSPLLGRLSRLSPNALARREEILFLLLFFLAVYVLGFNSFVKDTEKFMDYGFLTSMWRSEWMPFPDTWFSGEPINYYYGGQYFMAFLMRLGGTTPGYTYNLMRALLFSLSFVLPFSLACQFLKDRGGWEKLCMFCAALTGLAMSCSANGQYLVYGILLRAYHAWSGLEDDYFYPNPTRFMSTADGEENLAHEFPSYSSVLGDLHAHYINLMLVFLLLALLYAWSRRRLRPGAGEQGDVQGRRPLWLCWADPYILLLSLLDGIFRWTNFWDLPIYFVVCGAVILFTNLAACRPDYKRGIAETAIQGICFLALGTVAALPFTLHFQMISSRILPTHSHSSLYRLAVVWLMPFLTLAAFCRMLWQERAAFLSTGIFRQGAHRRAEGGGKKGKGKNRKGRKEQKSPKAHGAEQPERKNGALLQGAAASREAKPAPDAGKWHIDPTDMVLLLFGFCAAGLVLLPEFVYVEDIYTGASYRFNTMFKLTYQAFVLFTFLICYVYVRVLLMTGHSADAKAKKARKLAWLGIFLLILLSEYTVNAVKDRFGNIFRLSERGSLDASSTFAEYYPEELPALRWINENIEGQPVLLEAPGLSYTDYERVSTATGLPTVEGWHTHEHLWRGDEGMVSAREADVEAIYQGRDKEETEELLRKYGVSYIYIGKLEREKYPEMDEDFLRSLGETVYQDDAVAIVRLV